MLRAARAPMHTYIYSAWGHSLWACFFALGGRVLWSLLPTLKSNSIYNDIEGLGSIMK